MTTKRLFQFAFLAVLWVPVMEILELEWRFNEQYHYGYFVPFFTLYLLYLRWDDRPEPSRPTFSVFWLLLPVLMFIPVHLIQTANPDWRLVYWVATGTALLASVLYTDREGGGPWVRHFTPAWIMMLFAIPWLTAVENQVTSSLMDIVSTITVEVLNLLGIYAVQKGNVIHLQGAVVGIEEACSGVRSLQSSLMAGYLFGEIMRFRLFPRSVLIALGVGVTFLLNLFRTLLLTHITLIQGKDAFDKWHDPVGNGIAVGGFLSIALLAWIIRKIASARTHVPTPSVSVGGKVTLQTEHMNLREASLSMSVRQSLMFSSLLIGAIGLDHCWYQSPKGAIQGEFDYSNIQWENLSSEVITPEMNPIAKAQLKYSTGSQHLWNSSTGTHWAAFYFNWNSGNISSHAGVHKPENCLPASGITLKQAHDNFLWTTPEGFQIPFRVMTFEGASGQIYVFFAVWDENGTKPWVSTTWWERIQDVMHRRVVEGRHSMQFLAQNNKTLDDTIIELRQILNTMYL